jgi:hypothetical protein
MDATRMTGRKSTRLIKSEWHVGHALCKRKGGVLLLLLRHCHHRRRNEKHRLLHRSRLPRPPPTRAGHYRRFNRRSRHYCSKWHYERNRYLHDVHHVPGDQSGDCVGTMPPLCVVCEVCRHGVQNLLSLVPHENYRSDSANDNSHRAAANLQRLFIHVTIQSILSFADKRRTMHDVKLLNK